MSGFPGKQINSAFTEHAGIQVFEISICLFAIYKGHFCAFGSVLLQILINSSWKLYHIFYVANIITLTKNNNISVYEIIFLRIYLIV